MAVGFSPHHSTWLLAGGLGTTKMYVYISYQCAYAHIKSTIFRRPIRSAYSRSPPLGVSQE